MDNIFTDIIAKQLNISKVKVENTLRLLEDGCTIPFIARYRKERTGGLDEVQITAISEWFSRLKDIQQRKETVIKTISDQGKMTADLGQKIEQCWNIAELEDIYLPFKPKRKTRAQSAREAGLEPLAHVLLMQRDPAPSATAKRYVKGNILTPEAALQGAQDIIAEIVSEDQIARQQLRQTFQRTATITSKAVKAKKESEEAQKYSDYFDFSEPLRRCSGNRLLAMLRGERDGFLKITISVNDEEAIARLLRHYVRGHGPCTKMVTDAVADGYKRLLEPSISNEILAMSKASADDEAIGVFAENLRQLLLAAPLGPHRVMAIDPGFRTGCKVVCLDEQGNLLCHETIFPHPPQRYWMQSSATLRRLARQYDIEAIAIGNGTASRETLNFVKEALSFSEIDSERTAQEGENVPVPLSHTKVFTVSEDGASIYSASKLAREEFPDKDVTVRGAISIGRRLIDPLAELVKIDPKNIGVGQYQHDVDQAKLRHSLDQTVEHCVNLVGVDVNTASQQLLTYVSGLGPSLAKNIVDYRHENGPFKSRKTLKKVPRLGAVAFEQCAGFLRIPNAENPLDASAVHPERYAIVEQMAHDQGCSVKELIGNKDRLSSIDLQHYANDEVGMPSLTDIIHELDKPGRDPREEIEEFEFDPNVKEIGDLRIGMKLPGIVTNITKFGVFVDIGVHHDGLVHISRLANHFVSDPSTVVHLHQHVQVRVIEVDMRRGRISLSMTDRQ
ncbi:MAG: RNA-binding transcriptional accessory protein [Prevotella sp.]|nr:RNA-binding transcriptional accessory protein [Prevotella sp.]